MTRITIKAWHEDHYRSLAELLLVLGGPIVKLSWKLSIEEVAPGPEITQLESISRSDWVDTFKLLHLATPDVQIIDGEVSGYESPTMPYPAITIRAVDSTWWDIETEDKGLIDSLTVFYKDAQGSAL